MESQIIRLPVIESIRISDYPLYPGIDGDFNLTHPFEAGVSVIVGVNGQGKTTLLNILFRVMIGRWEQSKADLQNPGKRQHDLTEDRRFRYFSARVKGNADVAKAEIRLRFGEEKVRITRSLGAKLQITELWHGNTKIENPTEERWKELVAELSGLDNWYDFHFVVRHFLFFLEDKIPLLWNPYGQFEILRILFLDNELSNDCVLFHDQILRDDSIYRNQLWQVNQRKDRIRQLEAQYESEDAKLALENLRTTDERHRVVREDLEKLENDISRCLDEIAENETYLFQKDIELSNAKAELEIIERDFFCRALPDIHDAAKMVLGYLLSEDGCLVCGSHDQDVGKRISVLLEQGQCPACESIFKRDSKVVSTEEFDQMRLQKQELLVAELEKDRHATNVKLISLRDSHKILREERLTRQRECFLLEAKMAKAQGQGSLPSAILELRAEIDQERERLRGLSEALKHLRSLYEERLEEANKRIEVVSQEIVTRFRYYADEFLLEEACLVLDMHERTVGQSGQRLKFPNFLLKLSSPADREPHKRAYIDQVSESQREFIDLAFRMALLDVAVARLGPAMLVIETPEASLDAVFVERAGVMLRAFSKAHCDNRVIATSNINGENMIGTLLGTIGKDPEEVPMASFAPKMINLLEVGAKTRAYEREPTVYNKALKKAIYGR